MIQNAFINRGHGKINSVGFSPDGGLVVSGSSDGTVCVWDAQSGQLMLTLDGHTRSVGSVQISPDGSHVVSCSWGGKIRFWDMSRSMKDLSRIDHLTVPGRGHFARYSPDGSQVASGSYDGSLFVWKVTTGSMVLGPLAGHIHTVRAVDYSPNGLYIVSASYDCPLRIRYSNDGKDHYRATQRNILGVNCARFSPDSSLLLLGLDDKSVHVWNVQHQAPVAEPFLGHSGAIWSVAFSPNGSHVASGSDDCTIRVWDIQTGQTLIDPLQGHKRRVTSVEFSPDGSCILSCSWDRSIRTWDALTSQTILVFGEEHTKCINSVGFSPDGGLVVSGSDDCTVCVWDARNGELMTRLEGHSDWVLSTQFSPNGSDVVSCSLDGTIRFWDVSHCQTQVRDHGMNDDNERNNYSRVKTASKPWLPRDDGWVVDRADQLLVWVPPDLQSHLLPPANFCIIPKEHGFVLNVGRANIGDQWTNCYQP